MVWDGVIASYLFLAGMGAGAFALAAIAGWVKPDAVKFRMIGYIIAPVAVGVGTVLLMVDARAGLANPLRFFGLLTNLSSVMAWGVLVLIAFMIVSIVSLVLMARKHATPRVFDVIGIVLAVCVAMYTGLLLGNAPGFPLWNPLVLPLLFLVSSASTGFAVVLLVAHFMKLKDGEDIAFLRKTGLMLPVVEAVLIVVLLGVVGIANGGLPAASASVVNLVSGSYAPLFWIGLVAIGLVLPFCIELMQKARAGKGGSVGAVATAGGATAETQVAASSGLAIAGEVGVLVGGFLLRFLIIMAAVSVTMGAVL
ncbi:NrfD/PsrC family molybdoenzyme membrane anchor subunit [Eggerthella sp. YY7918]|uniref:NrfD/PsrC family molybdoenzyme membrane anchor subunit n=1 Tax=Eggerthella sp. (strain YY7918) TaxID=502558 RepID=UPI0002171313|nr:NrfD/PsrC family molybdoenzyme membrane anchor subunit [Eggerthella sp. YY7918]BAK45321.1 formate-dependent nitrite reductase [Eggerthella sp. YY7918]